MKKNRCCIQSLKLLALLMLAVTARAQTSQGNDGFTAAYQSVGSLIASYSLVDATQFGPPTSSICALISNVFNDFNNSTVNSGVIVDARAVAGSQLQCTNQDPNPWNNLGGQDGQGNKKGPFSNIVLLPSGTITIACSWILPDHTYLLGEGPNLTVIAAAQGFNSTMCQNNGNGSDNDMIDMGAEASFQTMFHCSLVGAPDCADIRIEHLALYGNGTVNGIVNCCAQELSHVKDVSVSNVNVGLWLNDGFAENSGPYTDLTINAVTCLRIGPAITAPPLTAPVLAGTRGVHGLNCRSMGSPAINVDGVNNTLEDISITGNGSGDGLLIGQNGPASGNVLVNIQGSGLGNLIHLSQETSAVYSNPPAPACPGPVNGQNQTSANNVCDTTILSATLSGSGNTIEDDLVLPNQSDIFVADPNVAMYVLGEPVVGTAGGTSSVLGYSRFTTATRSATAPTWLFGTGAPTGNCNVGSLYSCTGTGCQLGSVTATLWQCAGGNPGAGLWVGVQ